MGKWAKIDIENKQRICSRSSCEFAGQMQSFDNFSKLKNGPCGLRSECNFCHTKIQIKYQNDNKVSVSVYKKKHGPVYSKKNRAKIQQQQNERLKNDQEYRILGVLRSRVRMAVLGQHTKKAYKTANLIGCTVKELIAYLFDNYFKKTGIRASPKDISMYGLHIDHIIPCDTFDLTNPEEQKKCFHYTNMQLLWCEDNWKKSNRLDWKK